MGIGLAIGINAGAGLVLILMVIILTPLVRRPVRMSLDEAADATDAPASVSLPETGSND
jgi:hypothetical protein